MVEAVLRAETDALLQSCVRGAWTDDSPFSDIRMMEEHLCGTEPDSKQGGAVKKTKTEVVYREDEGEEEREPEGGDDDEEYVDDRHGKKRTRNPRDRD
jgi:hypothetical protein